MSRLKLVVVLFVVSRLMTTGLISLTLIVFPPSARADTADIRREMLEAGNIAAYPMDDDDAAISAYLNAVTDGQIDIPPNIAQFIIGKLQTFTQDDTSRLIGAYLYYLKGSSTRAPLSCLPVTSTRNQLLNAMFDDLSRRKTPVTELALELFRDCDDPALQARATSASYQELLAYPWLVGNADWMEWFFHGIDPYTLLGVDLNRFTDSAHAVALPKSEKAGLLVNAPASLNGVKVDLPQTASGLTLYDLMTPKISGWGVTTAASQAALAVLYSNRFADTLKLGRLSNASLDAIVSRGEDPRDANTFGRLYFPDLGLRSYDPPLASLSAALTAEEDRLLAMSAFALTYYQRQHGGQAEVLSLADVIPRLSQLQVLKSEDKTTIVDDISAASLQGASPSDSDVISKCKPSSYRVKIRIISIKDRQYIERLSLACGDGSQQQVTATGRLSSDLARELEINPHFLDIIGSSLTQRDREAENMARFEQPDDIDLVRVNPRVAAALSLGLLWKPTVPWTFARAALMQEWPPKIDWFVPGWKQRPALLTVAYSSGQLVRRSDHDYAALRDDVLAGEKQYLQFEASWRFYHDLWPVVEAMPSEITNCSNFIMKFLSFGGSCGESYRTPRAHLAQQLNDIATAANKLATGVGDLIIPQCVKPNHNADEILTITNSDQSLFTEVFSAGYGDCYFGSEAPLKLPSPMDQWLREALAADPLFLNRYQLSLYDIEPGSAERLADALLYAHKEKLALQAAYSLLFQSDRVFDLPTADRPRTDNPNPQLTELWPLDLEMKAIGKEDPQTAAIAPLLATRTGEDIAEDLIWLRELKSALPSAPSSHKTTVSDEFVGRGRTAEQQLLNQVYAKADADAAPIANQIRDSNKGNFEVGFSLTGGATLVPGVSFTYNGVGINASFGPDATLIVAPEVKPLKLPGLTLASGRPIDWSSAVKNGAGTPSGQEVATNIREADDGGGDVSVEIGNVDWGELLSANNLIGRSWLEGEINVARPFLTAEQLGEIQSGLSQPSFPESLAKVIVEASAKASLAGTKRSLEAMTTGQTVEKLCSSQTWSACALAVKQALDKGPEDPHAVVLLANVWGRAYGKQFDALRASAHLDTSVPEAEKIEDEVSDALNPISIAKDKVEEKLLKKCLGRLAFLMEWESSPISGVIQGLLSSTDVASDYDELRLADDLIGDKVADQLRGYMNTNWRDLLGQAVKDATPALTGAAPGVSHN